MQTDPTAATAIWSALSAIVAVVMTQGVKALIVWLRAREQAQGKGAAFNGRMAMSDREQLTKFIEDMRQEQQRTDARMDDTLKRLADLQTVDAEMRAELAVARNELIHAQQAHEHERTEWARERQQLMAEIQTLKEQVAQLQRRTRGT